MKLCIKDCREKSNLTQVELCEKSGVSRATLWKLETNEHATTTLNTLVSIAKALDIPVSDLFLDDSAQ